MRARWMLLTLVNKRRVRQASPSATVTVSSTYTPDGNTACISTALRLGERPSYPPLPYCLSTDGRESVAMPHDGLHRRDFVQVNKGAQMYAPPGVPHL